MRYQGTITRWEDDKGFGFITQPGSKEPVFLHISDFVSRGRRPVLGDRVSYHVLRNDKNRPQAMAIQFAAEAFPDPRRSAVVKVNAGWLLWAVSFVLLLLLAAFSGFVPVWLLLVYGVASFITFCVYSADKSAAQARNWRTPESTLHWLALCCGWPGAVLAQQLLRHKSSKTGFRRIFWLTMLANLAALAYLLSPAGKHWLALADSLLPGI